jgi:hypothetical protein
MDRLKCFRLALFLDNVDITLNTRLRVLELGDIFNFHVGVQCFDDRLPLLPQLLFKIPKAALTTIKFEFWTLDDVDWQINGNLMMEVANTDATWMAIDELLTGSSFSVLTEVVFTVYYPHGFEVAKYLELRLARCKQKGLLRISYI